MDEFDVDEGKKALVQERLRAFCARHASEPSRRVALVTSGGTSVPLERHVVRYIDNFSAGNRGAASTEHLHRRGYAVIFLHRLNSVLPYARHFTKGSSILDNLVLKEPATTAATDDDGRGGGPHLEVSNEQFPHAVQVYVEYRRVMAEQLLLSLSFETLGEYLTYLTIACEHLQPFGARAMLYLAAAVSDFYIPRDQLPVHKIQSSQGPPTLSFKLTPKLLRSIAHDILPSAFIVSFKLETDARLLIDRCKQALLKYGHQLVIGNVLDSRKRQVQLVTDTGDVETVLAVNDHGAHVEIELNIVQRVVQLHDRFIADRAATAVGGLPSVHVAT